MHKLSLRSARWSGLLACTILAVSGCGGASDAPKLGKVSGTVKLDGQPIAGVKVIFESNVVARSAIGSTDEQGKYEVNFSKGVKGAPIGKCKVKFDMPMQPEKQIFVSKIPSKYLTEAQFEKEVVEGKNQFDFDLSSEGASDKPGINP